MECTFRFWASLQPSFLSWFSLTHTIYMSRISAYIPSFSPLTMFSTRVRALFSTQLRRQTAAPSSGGGGRFDLKTPAGKNNAMLAAGGVTAVLGGSYYMGYWDTEKAKDTAASVKKD